MLFSLQFGAPEFDGPVKRGCQKQVGKINLGGRKERKEEGEERKWEEGKEGEKEERKREGKRKKKEGEGREGKGGRGRGRKSYIERINKGVKHIKWFQ